jgi:hypothetical protein
MCNLLAPASVAGETPKPSIGQTSSGKLLLSGPPLMANVRALAQATHLGRTHTHV